MSIHTAIPNATSQILKSLLHKDHSISIFSKEAAYAIEATAIKTDLDGGKITLEITYSGNSLSPYLKNGLFDVGCGIRPLSWARI